jgi:hypothetical protein
LAQTSWRVEESKQKLSPVGKAVGVIEAKAWISATFTPGNRGSSIGGDLNVVERASGG